jgi:cationic amino acid transporter 3
MKHIFFSKIYIYVTIGEFIAFILGWDLILEYVIGVSSGATALSRYIDSLLDNKIQYALEKAMPMSIEGLASYPDFLAFALVMLITFFMVIGVKESTLLNKIFTAINICVILFIFICGLIKANLSNWEIKADVSFYLALQTA